MAGAAQGDRSFRVARCDLAESKPSELGRLPGLDRENRPPSGPAADPSTRQTARVELVINVRTAKTLGKKRLELRAHSRFGHGGPSHDDSAPVSSHNAPFPSYKAPHVHFVSWQRGGVAVRGTRAAGGQIADDGILIKFYPTQLARRRQRRWERPEGTCRSPRLRSKRYHHGTRQSVPSCVESPRSSNLVDSLHV